MAIYTRDIMQNWQPNLKADGEPIYRAIANALEQDILAGTLAPGYRLPPQRDLAQRLGVDLTTITKAYTLVRNAGLIEGGGRRGSFVRAITTETAVLDAQSAELETGMNMPPVPASARFLKAYREFVTASLTDARDQQLVQYQPVGGTQEDRLAAVSLAKARGLGATEDRIVLTAGGQNAISAIIVTSFSAGEVLCTAPYVYPGLLSLARRHGLQILALDVDAEGICPASFEAACQSHSIKALYVVPTNDNPTTISMGVQRRKDIAAIAQHYGVMIIEDDAYGQLPEVPMVPIAAYAPDMTWHIASFSKCLSPMLRVAHVVAPSIMSAMQIASAAHESAIMPPPLNVKALTQWIMQDQLKGYIAEIRRESAARQAIVRGLLKAVSYAADSEGYHLWVPLTGRTSAQESITAMRPLGLSVVASEAFAVNPNAVSSALRISIGGTISHIRLERAMRVLDALMDTPGQRNPMII
jgi:DNA-binding transcriptional MocR family regulator